MNARWKSFERAMRRLVRTEVRGSKVLRQEYKQSRKARRARTIIRPWVYRLFFPLIGMATLMQTGRPLTLIIAFIWLWVLAAAFLHANQLNLALYFSPGLNVFHHLPIPDGQIFQVQWSSWIRNSLWSALHFFAAYSALVFHIGNGLDSVVVVTGTLLGVLQWIFVLAMATCLFVWWPRSLFHLPVLLFAGCAVALLIFEWRQTALVNWLSGFAYWIPSVGWILYAVGIIANTGLVHDLLPSVMAGAVFVAFPVAYRRIRHNYVLREEQFAAARKATVTGEAAVSRWQEFVDRFTDKPAEVESEVRSRRFLQHLDWRSVGWIEGLIARTLTARECTVAEFLVAANPQWTRKLRGFLISAAVFLVLVCFLVANTGLDPTFLVVMGACWLIVQSSGNWRGFATVSAAGPQPPPYSFHPIGFWELFRTILKINTVRYTLSFPVVGLIVLLAQVSLRLNPATAAVHWWRILVLGFLAQIILAIAPISATSNDSNRLPFATAVVAFILAEAALGCVFVFASSPALIISSLATLCAFLAAGVLLYGRRFNHSRFDLIPVAQTVSGLPQ